VIARTALALAALLLAAPATAQDRPAEADLFGAPAPGEPAAPQPAAPATEPPAAGRDDAMLGARAGAPPAGVLTAAQENPLAVGGQLYLRSSASYVRYVPPSKWQLSSPNLLDLYVDTRPNDRVRAFVLARTSWDPLALPPGSNPFFPSHGPDPRAVLDQLWVNFDVARTVFVTVGKQHVKWGVGRFWNPTDYLHPVRRDPLAPFDARTGATMVKLHVPWEAKGWNFYGLALLDDPAGKGDSATTLGKVAGGARAEIVFGSIELGADALVRRGQRPRFGLDFSAGLWDLDILGEVALRTSSDVPLWQEANPTGPLVGPDPRFVPRTLGGVSPQVVLGVSYAVNYSDEDAIRFGAEYFYNGPGYDDPHIYPWLLVEPAWFGPQAPAVATAIGVTKTNDFRSFYVGRHYAGLSVVLAAPGSWNDHTFSLNAIANASDGSAIVRLDHSMVVNTYLTVESYLAGNVGKEGGEFRFSLDVPSQSLPGPVVTPAIRTQPTVMAAGVAVRVKL
jgi:hypothetical protein